jgi:hypothetical protein
MGLRGSAPPVFKTVEHDSEITTDARENWPSIDLISTVPILMLSFSGRSLLTAAVGRFNNSTARKPFDKANLAYIGYKPLRSLCNSSAAHDSDQMAADSKGAGRPATCASRISPGDKPVGHHPGSPFCHLQVWFMLVHPPRLRYY